MAETKISALPTKTTLDTSDYFPIVDSNGVITKKVTKQALANSLGDTLSGWNTLNNTIGSITHLGNRSFSGVFTSDPSGVVSPKMRFRFTRNTAAPTQCTSLNGTNQYYSKTSPAGMTFTDDFVVSAWVKLSSYQDSVVVGRFNGTSGWRLRITSTGQVQLEGYNGGGGNFRLATSYQSLPLNKWVHVAAQLDMSAYTATSTTMYIMIDGVDVPITLAQGGTNPTTLVQAGNFEIGSANGGTLPFPGKIAQVAIYNAKVTQATIKAAMNQGLVGTETSLISAYSFSNSINDLNTTNANNLTANGSAVATNADSPFTTQGDGTISGTLDYAILMKTSGTTAYFQCPEGCMLPTTGTISSIAYSTADVPYGFPGQSAKWRVAMTQVNDQTVANVTTFTNIGSSKLTVPLGEWNLGYFTTASSIRAAAATFQAFATLSTGSTTESDRDFTAATGSGSVTYVVGTLARSKGVTTTTATDYYLNFKASAANDFTYQAGSLSPTLVYADNAYL